MRQEAIQEVRVIPKPELDADGKRLTIALRDKHPELAGLQAIRVGQVYRFQGISLEEIKFLAERLLHDPLIQRYSINSSLIDDDAVCIVEVAYYPGVADPLASTVSDAAGIFGVNPQAVTTSREYAFYGAVSSNLIDQIARQALVNPVIQRIIDRKPSTLLVESEYGSTKWYELAELDDQALTDLSTTRQLNLDLDSMIAIRSYAKEKNRSISDVELEILAGAWSEHCVHTTFKSDLVINGQTKKPLFTRIKDAANNYITEKKVLSAFEDNSGVISFYDGWAINIKLETHNSPSAIEPFGGAGTGVGGWIRDVFGTGQGAKVLFGVDILAFAPWVIEKTKLPPGCLPPDYLFKGVVAGIGDYGNKIGVPTFHGSVHFHDDFRAKPVVMGGAVGILPEKSCQKGKPEKGDLVVLIGGKTGKDGIHGATFSSADMTAETQKINSTSVQIGDPIVEKKLMDLIEGCLGTGLIRAITDCGAAGLSSAVGEMGQQIGVEIDLRNVPLKYPGLSPWEIFLSESQERMVLAVDPSKLENIQKLAGKHDVELSVLGKFGNGQRQLVVTDGSEAVAVLDYSFLTEGQPKKALAGHYQKPIFDESKPPRPTDWITTIEDILSHGNVCSKEKVARRYDAGVQGMVALSEFTGINLDVPNEVVVIAPLKDKNYGVVFSHALNPILNRLDPYWGAVWAGVAAISKYVSVGGDPQTAVLVNNYVEPTPDNPQVIGSLDLQVDGLIKVVEISKSPIISGKDSLSGTYRNKETGEVIEVPPVVNISVLGKIEDVNWTTSIDFKTPSSTVCLVGNFDQNLGGSVYYQNHGLLGDNIPRPDLGNLPKVLNKIHQGIKGGKILSCAAVAEGGVMTSLAKMCFGGEVGAGLTIDDPNPERVLFNETAGCFIVEVSSLGQARELFQGVIWQVLGNTTADKTIEVSSKQRKIFTANLDELKVAWQKPLAAIFN